MIGKVQVVSWNRVSPCKDDPARAELEEKCNAMFKREDERSLEAGKAYEAYRSAKLYSKKREALEKKYDKLKEKNAALAIKDGHEELRKQWRQMHLEDLAEYSECSCVQTVALAELGHVTHNQMREQLNKLLIQEAREQDVESEEDIKFIAGSVMNYLITFPSHLNAKSLVRNEKERLQKGKLVSEAYKQLDTMEFAPKHSGTGQISLSAFTTMLEELRGQTVQEVIDGIPKVLEQAKEQSKLWKKHLADVKRAEKKKKDDYFKGFVDITSECGQLLIPKVKRVLGLIKILKEASASRDYIRTAIETGWATDGRFLLLLSDNEREELQQNHRGSILDGRFLTLAQIQGVIPAIDAFESEVATCTGIRELIGCGDVGMLYESSTGAALSIKAEQAVMIEARWGKEEGVTAHILYEKSSSKVSKLVYTQTEGISRRVVGLITAYHNDYNRGPNDPRQKATDDGTAVCNGSGAGEAQSSD